MLKKLFTLSLMLLFASSFLVAQNTHILKANGDLIKLKDSKNFREALVATKTVNGSGKTDVKNVVMKAYADVQGTLDTLKFVDGGVFNTNFGMFDGNVMLQYFQAPADLIIKGAGFSVSDATGAANATISLRLLKLNWTWDELIGVPAPLNMGTYPEEGDGLGGIDPFGENATGNWQDFSEGAYPLPPWADNVDPAANTFEYDLWSDAGFGWPFTAELQAVGGGVYQWVDMIDLGFEPEISAGEVFAVALVHDGADPAFADRIGFWSDNTLGIPGWKYYEEGRLADGDGWWTRLYTWDFAVAVDLVGDRAPQISGVTRLLTTVDTGPQTVEAMIVDDNPSGGEAGVASAEIHYSLDGGATYTPVAMTDMGGDMFSGDVPGQSPGTNIMYKVVATDVGGLSSESTPTGYGIFQVVNTNLLVIFNGGSEGRAAQLTPFYLQGLVPAYDLWAAYGPVSDFINQYDAVIEIHSEGGPADDNQAALTGFAASGNKKLAVIGQETLGYLNAFTDSTFVAGDYEYEILGVMNSYNDVNYNPDAGFDQTMGSPVAAIAGTAYGDSLAMWFASTGLDTLLYDPGAILGADNWMDQFDPRSDLGDNHEVFLHAFAWDGTERPAGHSWTHPVNTDILFMTADPLSFNSDSGWVGNSTWTPLAQFIQDKIVSVRQTDNNVPTEHSLSQNYPNPFNPSTTINFALNKSGLTTLKVYNILGQEVATLVNRDLAAGSYSVDFDASELSSGMYIYTIKNGEFEISKKMMLLK
jgi:hypothetical protein